MSSFYTSTHVFSQMYLSEVKDLKKGDAIVVCTAMDIPKKATFENAVVTGTYDVLTGKIETNLGSFSAYEIYCVEER